MANWDNFDFAFTCPESVTDDALRVGYEKMLAEVRKESENHELSVGQIIRAETMIKWYIKHQQTSKYHYGEDHGYQHPGQEKDAMLALQGVTRDYDEILLKARSKAPVVQQGVPEEAVREALVTVLRSVEDPALRRALQARFVSEFEKLGV